MNGESKLSELEEREKLIIGFNSAHELLSSASSAIAQFSHALQEAKPGRSGRLQGRGVVAGARCRPPLDRLNIAWPHAAMTSRVQWL